MRRSEGELAKMRRAGRVVAEMHERTREAIRPGVTTAALDLVAREVLARRGATSNFLGYGSPPFPAVICASPNEVVVHGIPSAACRLQEGDIVSIDCGAIVEGYHGDAAYTAAVGAVSATATALMEATERALWAGIGQMVDGARLHDIGRAVEESAAAAGYQVVREYTGHAIGTRMHEEPSVPNYWPGRPGPRLRPGMVFAVEPMVTPGTAATYELADGWTVVTADGALSAHFEHTIAITDNGPEVLTRP